MKSWRTIGVVLAALTAACFAAKEQGLHLTVPDSVVEAGASVTLQWEIVPDGQGSVSIVLGVILPNGEIRCYKGPGKGFVPFEGLDSAAPIVTDFPFNTPLSASVQIATSEAWPRGTCQFIAAVMDGKTVIEFAYSNSFSIH